MHKQDLVSVLLTFTVGVIAGGYLYLIGFAPQFIPTGVPGSQAYDELTITGEQYGGCQMTRACPSFQIRADGSYRYAQGSTADERVSVREGRLPNSLRRDVLDVMRTPLLEESAEPVERDACPSYADGADARYDVSKDGERYRLDTCHTALSPDTEPGRTLAKLWNYFRNEVE